MTLPQPSPIPAFDMPRRIEDIDAAFLTRALARNCPGVEVTQVEIGEVIWGTATKVPLALTYNAAGNAHGLPPSMWLKAPIESPYYDLVATLYTTEVQFYRDLVGNLDLGSAVPQCFFADADPGGAQPTLLLEDLLARQARFPGPEALGIDDVAALLSILAALHARSWNVPELASLPRHCEAAFVPLLDYFGKDDVYAEVMTRSYAAGTPRELQDAAMLRSIAQAVLRPAPGPRALLHGDPHIGNTFIASDGPGLLDWQLICEGAPLDDVAYLMITCLDIADRRNAERSLIAHYLAELGARGVKPPSFDAAWLDYRKYAFHAFVWVMVPEEQQSFAARDAISRRGVAAVADLETVRAWGPC